jgi:hypothetical protein
MSLFPNVSNDPKIAMRQIDAEAAAAMRASEMGRLGSWLGNRDHAAIYMAGFLAFSLLVFMAAVAFAPVGTGLDRGDIFKLLGGFFLGTIGYLFGSLKGGGRE